MIYNLINYHYHKQNIMLKNLLIIGLNTLILLIIFECGFKIYDLSQPDYFDNKKKIIAYYSDSLNHPFIDYSDKRSTAGKQIHAEPGVYFQTTTNSDGFRTKRFLPKLDETFRVILIGGSFVYGMNSNDNETLGVQLEKSYRKNISKKMNQKITIIGKINKRFKKNLLLLDNKPINLVNFQGYSHKF